MLSLCKSCSLYYMKKVEAKNKNVEETYIPQKKNVELRKNCKIKMLKNSWNDPFFVK